MKKLKVIITLLAITLSVATLKGQDNMVINLVDHSAVATAISDIQRITFGSDDMMLKTKDGIVKSYPLDNIATITFLDGTGIEHFTETIDVTVFVNASGDIVVEAPCPINKLTVFDLAGKQVAISAQSPLNVNFLNTGVYILQVATDKGTVSKKFIKNR